MAGYFPFVQVELTQGLGPTSGRYLIRSAEAVDEEESPGEPALGSDDVLVVQTHGAAPARRSLLRRGGRSVGDEPDGQREVSVTLATLVRARLRMPDRAAAEHWLAEMKPVESQEAWVADGMRVLNRAAAAYRACAADPHVGAVSREDPGAIRIGFGTAEEVYRGRWSQAMSVLLPAAPKLPRQVMLMPTEAVAAVLAGRGRTLESEDLLLRVLLDLDQGHLRGAAVGLQGAVELLLAELAGEPLSAKAQQRQARVVDGLDELRALAGRGRAGGLGPAEATRLAELAEEAGSLVDRWRYDPAALPPPALP